MRALHIFSVLAILGISGFLVSCGDSLAKNAAGERGIRPDSPLLKVTPDFKGFDWEPPRPIGITDFTGERVYFFILDRFANGDQGNDLDAIPGNNRAYNGGDLKGATSRLKYIKDLGFSAIWISPIVDNDEPPAGGVWWFYHGYHFKDPYTVDEHFGKNQDFVDFVGEAHKLGLKVLLDVVVNHSGFTFPLRPERRPEFTSWFHYPFKDIQDYSNEKDSVEGSILGAPDFDQRNPHAAAFLTDYIKFWISTAKIDGLRLDTVKHAHLEFWPKFSTDIKDFAGPGFFLMGEVWESGIPAAKKYMNEGKLDSLVDFPLYYKMEQVFAKDGNMNELSRDLQEDGQWNHPEQLGVFVDNHDVVRFSREAGVNAKDLLKSSLAFIYTIRGFPIVYYGTETMMRGSFQTDWGGRDPMPWAEVDAGKHAEMAGYLRKLNELKANSPALQHGVHTEIYKDYSVYAYVRSIAGDAVLAIINKQPDDADYTFKLPVQAGFGGELTDVLSGQKFTMNGDLLTMKLKARQSYLFHATGGRALAVHWTDANDRMPAGIAKTTFKIKAPQAKEVVLAGEFNGWDQKSMKLDKSADGTFSITIPLKTGSYQYKYLVDGAWTVDPGEDKNAGAPYNNSMKIVK